MLAGRRDARLFCRYDEGVDVIDNECEESPEQGRQEDAAQNQADGMKVQVAV